MSASCDHMRDAGFHRDSARPHNIKVSVFAFPAFLVPWRKFCTIYCKFVVRMKWEFKENHPFGEFADLFPPWPP